MNEIVEASQTSTQELQEQMCVDKEKNRRELADLQRQLRERTAELEQSRHTAKALQEEVTHTHTHTHTHTCAHIHTHPRAHTHTHTHTHAHTWTDTGVLTHTHAHTYMESHRCTQTHNKSHSTKWTTRSL